MTEPTQDPQAKTVTVDATAPWKSKTLWAAALTAVLPMVPGVGPVLTAYAAANPQAVMAIVGAVFAGLRLVSQGKIKLK